jgi:hypothetical protein
MKLRFRNTTLIEKFSKNVGILYHYTSLASLINIAKDDFILKDRYKRYNYISFTRNGSGIVGRGEGPCRLILDGNKLSNKYKIVPDSMARTPNGEGIKDDLGNLIFKSHERRQQEERIYKSEVKVKDCLLKIEILKDYANDDLTKDELSFLKSFGINFELIKSYKPYNKL